MLILHLLSWKSRDSVTFCAFSHPKSRDPTQMRPLFAPPQLLHPRAKSLAPSWTDKLTVGAVQRPPNLSRVRGWLGRCSCSERGRRSKSGRDRNWVCCGLRPPQTRPGSASGIRDSLTEPVQPDNWVLAIAPKESWMVSGLVVVIWDVSEIIHLQEDVVEFGLQGGGARNTMWFTKLAILLVDKKILAQFRYLMVSIYAGY
jgi:hypothetical protein